MSKNSLKNNSLLPANSCAGLFDNIILTITSEKELKAGRKLWFLFLFSFFVSVAFLPFSFAYVAVKWQSSGIFYFISAPFLNPNVFFHSWQDFALSIIEVFPIIAVTVFAINVTMVLSAIFLFLHQKGALLKCLKNSFFHGRKKFRTYS